MIIQPNATLLENLFCTSHPNTLHIHNIKNLQFTIAKILRKKDFQTAVHLKECSTVGTLIFLYRNILLILFFLLIYCFYVLYYLLTLTCLFPLLKIGYFPANNTNFRILLLIWYSQFLIIFIWNFRSYCIGQYLIRVLLLLLLFW